MKSITSLLAIAALAGSPLVATAQQPATTPPAKADSDKHKDWKKHREFMEGLPEDVRKRFKEAKEEAMKNPEIQALREKAEAASKELRDAVRNAIAEKNPDLAEQLANHLKTKDGEPKEKDKKHRKSDKPEAAPAKKLPPEERSRLEAAREIAKQAPSVQSAEAAMKAATTPEARRDAAGNFQKAMHEAILTADPSLADVLEKIKPAKPESTPAAAPDQAP